MADAGDETPSHNGTAGTSDGKIPSHLIIKYKKEHFVPAYLVVVIKRLSGFDFTAGTIDASMTLVLRLVVGGIHKNSVEALKKMDMRLNGASIKLKEDNIKVDDDNITFTLRLQQTITFTPNLHNFPFDIQDINIMFELTSKKIGDSLYRFNLYRYPHHNGMLRFRREPRKTKFVYLDDDGTEKRDAEIEKRASKEEFEDDPDSIPDLNIAYGMISIPQTPPEKKHDGTTYYPSMKVRFHLYREPEYILLTCYFPLLVLDLISICTFALEPCDYPDRLAMIVTILLALFAFLPTCRQGIAIPTLTALDVSIFLSVFIIFLIIVDSFISTFNDEFTRILFPTISAACILLVCVYTAVRYIQYRRGKPTLDGKTASNDHDKPEKEMTPRNAEKQRLITDSKTVRAIRPANLGYDYSNWEAPPKLPDGSEHNSRKTLFYSDGSLVVMTDNV